MDRHRKESMVKSRKKKEPELRICAYCGKEFATISHNKKYCSEECSKQCHVEQVAENRKQRKLSQVAKICEECGKVFWIDADSTAHFCSIACIHKMMKRRTTLETECIVCGKSFIADDKRKKMCSAECTKIRNRQLQRKYPTKSKKYTISENTSAIAQRNEQARVLGLSYGQYDIKLYLESLKQREARRSMHEQYKKFAK